MLEKMQELIADQLSVDADSITEASSFKEDLGADSLDLFELMYRLTPHSLMIWEQILLISMN